MKVTFLFPQVIFLLAQVLAWKWKICCRIVKDFHEILATCGKTFNLRKDFHETLATCGNMKTFMFHLPVWHSLITCIKALIGFEFYLTTTSPCDLVVNTLVANVRGLGSNPTDNRKHIPAILTLCCMYGVYRKCKSYYAIHI